MPLPYGRPDHDAFPMRADDSLLGMPANAREYRSRSLVHGERSPRAGTAKERSHSAAAGGGGDAVPNKGRAPANAQPQPMRVFLRIRPYLDAEVALLHTEGLDPARSAVEKKENGEIWVMDERCLALKPSINLKAKRTYPVDTFDEVLWSFGEDAEKRWDDDIQHEYRGQAHVFRSVNTHGDTTLVNKVYEGYSQAVITYGVTNAGKTYTMFGDTKDPGLATRFLEKVSSKATRIEQKFLDEKLKVTLEASVIRVWKEVMEDLLAKEVAGERAVLKGMTDLDSLTQVSFTSLADLHALVARLHKIRKPSAKTELTKDNRSHVVLTVTITQTSTFESPDEPEKRVQSVRKSTLTLVDVGAGGKAEGETAQDGRLISLAPNALNRVLSCLASRTAVPHRDSVLTQLLQDQLGGNCGTTFIGCVGPYYKHHHDTHLTVEALRKLRSVISMVAPPTVAELHDLRNLHREKNTVMKHIVAQNSNVMKVRDALERLQRKVNKREKEHRDVAQRLAAEQQRHDQIAAATARCRAALCDVKRYRKLLIPTYDARIKKHKAAKADAKKQLAALNAKIGGSIALYDERTAMTDDYSRRLDIVAEVLLGHALATDASVGPVPDEQVDAVLTETAAKLDRLEAILAERTSYEEDERLAVEIQRYVEDTVDAAKRLQTLDDRTQAARAAADAERRGWRGDIEACYNDGLPAGGAKLALPAEGGLEGDVDELRRATAQVGVLAAEAQERRAIEEARAMYMRSLPQRYRRVYEVAAVARAVEAMNREAAQVEEEARAVDVANAALQDELYAAEEQVARDEGLLEVRRHAYEEEMKYLREKDEKDRAERQRQMEIEEARSKREAELELARLKAQTEAAAAEQQRLALEAQKSKGGCCTIS